MRTVVGSRQKAEGRGGNARPVGPRLNGWHAVAVIFCALVVGGCASQNKAPDNVKTLRGGYDALAAGNYSGAMDAANSVLAANPQGTLAAEAHYLRGRVYEEAAMASPVSSAQAANLQNARNEYREAISLPHKTDLDGDARAGAAMVAFEQDDYATALQQWQASYPELKKPEDKVLALYRMGQAAQRLGQWPLADQYFQQVQQQAPGTDVARNARMHEGARAFVVQVATFSSPAQASMCQRQLQAEGIATQTSVDPSFTGHVIVRTGPMGSYAQAKALRDRVLFAYPAAMIVP